MGKDYLAPPGNRMACCTLDPKQAVMRFITGVTGDTGWIISLVGFILMAVQTFQIIMPPGQDKARRAVIENGEPPSFGSMADATLISHLFLMHIILLMAKLACLRSSLQHL